MPKSKDIQLQALPVFEYRGQIVADSRDVAELIGRPHRKVLRTIETMSKHLSETKIGLAAGGGYAGRDRFGSGNGLL